MNNIRVYREIFLFSNRSFPIQVHLEPISFKEICDIMFFNFWKDNLTLIGRLGEQNPHSRKYV